MNKTNIRDVDPTIKINEDPIGLFNFTYNDLKKQSKVSLEDVGVLAYGNFIFYEPTRITWFKQFTELADKNPDEKVWKLLRVRGKIFGWKESRYKTPLEESKEHVFEKPDMKRNDLFELLKSTETYRINPFTGGFIVSVKNREPIHIWYKLCEDQSEKHVVANGPTPFSHTYPGPGKFHGYFVVRNKKKFWKRIEFEVDVEENTTEPGDIITNFYQTKAAGQTAASASGLDVSFSIASGMGIDRTKWVFGDEKKGAQPEPKKKSLDLSVSHIYKHYRKEPWRGTVTAWDHQGNHKSRKFFVIMCEL